MAGGVVAAGVSITQGVVDWLLVDGGVFVSGDLVVAVVGSAGLPERLAVRLLTMSSPFVEAVLVGLELDTSVLGAMPMLG